LNLNFHVLPESHKQKFHCLSKLSSVTITAHLFDHLVQLLLCRWVPQDGSKLRRQDLAVAIDVKPFEDLLQLRDNLDLAVLQLQVQEHWVCGDHG
jgi:hypothetical protein